MKSYIKILLCLVTFASTVSLDDMKAYGSEEMAKCPSGCFCIYDGLYPTRYLSAADICKDYVAHPVSCNTKDEEFTFAYGDGQGEGGGQLTCDRSKDAVYYFVDFSELYKGETGVYGYIGEDLIVMAEISSGYGSIMGQSGIYVCPSSYPESARGAKTLYECYTHDEKGNKVYYNNVTDSKDIKTLATNLQNALNQAVQIVLDLQRVATQQKQANKTNDNTINRSNKTKYVVTNNSAMKSTADFNMRKARTLKNKSAIIH